MGRLVFHALRWIERLAPPSVLQFFLWPIAAAKTTWELAGGRPTVGDFRRLPACLMPPREPAAFFWRIWWPRTRMNLTKLMKFWPDRLRTARWQERIRCVGLAEFEKARARGRPVILAMLHFGPATVLRYWLRARGWPAAGLVARPLKERSALARLADRQSDRASGLGGVPHVFNRTRLRQLVRFLRPPNLLLMTVEGVKSGQVFIGGEDYSLPLATGAVRLAALTGAVLIPCLAYSHRPLGLTVHFGKPAPPPAGKKDPGRAAYEHLLREFVSVIRIAPEQCSFELLWRFRPLVPPRKRRYTP